MTRSVRRCPTTRRLHAANVARCLTQGLRDYFRYTYRRTDKEGSFHIPVGGDRSEVTALSVSPTASAFCENRSASPGIAGTEDCAGTPRLPASSIVVSVPLHPPPRSGAALARR